MSNPTVINNGPPPPKLEYAEEAVAAAPSDPNLKVKRITVTTDRAIPGAVIGFVFSGPIEAVANGPDAPSLENAGVQQCDWGMALQNRDGPIPNTLWVRINMPSAFSPGHKLIVTVKSKADVRVLQVVVVG